MQEPHVLIIGAGITGLLIAHGLKQAGVKYTILESEDAGRQRPKEWTMGIHWSLPLLEGLLPPDLASRIVKDASVDPTLDYEEPPNNGAYIFDGVSGQVLKDLAVTGRIVRVSRRKLRALCTEGIDIKYGYTLSTITTDSNGTVTVECSTGEAFTGTLLVGCDGPRSSVRSVLFGSDPTAGAAQAMSGCVNISYFVTYPAETARFVRSKSHPVWCMAINPDVFHFMSLQDVVDPERPETWKFFHMTTWIGEKPAETGSEYVMKALKERGAKLAEPFRTAIVSIPDETPLAYTDIVYWIATPWETLDGLVTLAGDSAHPMPPFRGQGGNHAIQDAHNLVEAVKKIAASNDESARQQLQTELIRTYSDEVAKRGAEETNLSTKNGRMLMAYTDFKESPYMKQGLSR